MSYAALFFTCTLMYMILVEFPCNFTLFQLCKSQFDRLGVKHFFFSYAEYNFISADILPDSTYNYENDIKTLYHAEFEKKLDLPTRHFIDKDLKTRLQYNYSCATIQRLKKKL